MGNNPKPKKKEKNISSSSSMEKFLKIRYEGRKKRTIIPRITLTPVIPNRIPATATITIRLTIVTFLLSRLGNLIHLYVILII
jgi:hypothetical protein